MPFYFFCDNVLILFAVDIYVERKKRYKINDQPCDCIPPDDDNMGCDEDCINRCMFYECNAKTCPCKEKCSNRAFQSKAGLKNADMQVFYVYILLPCRFHVSATLLDSNSGVYVFSKFRLEQIVGLVLCL